MCIVSVEKRQKEEWVVEEKSTCHRCKAFRIVQEHSKEEEEEVPEGGSVSKLRKVDGGKEVFLCWDVEKAPVGSGTEVFHVFARGTGEEWQFASFAATSACRLQHWLHAFNTGVPVLFKIELHVL